MQICLISLSGIPTNFSIHREVFSCGDCYYDKILMRILVSPSLLAIINWNSLRKIFPSPMYFCEYEFIHIHSNSVWIYRYLPYSLGCNSVLLNFHDIVKIIQLWPLGVLISWFLCPLDGILIFLKHIFIFWPYIIQVQLHGFLCLSFEISHFFSEPFSFFHWKMVYLTTWLKCCPAAPHYSYFSLFIKFFKVLSCYWGPLRTELGNMCVCVCVYTLAHVCTYL